MQSAQKNNAQVPEQTAMNCQEPRSVV